MAEHVLLVAVSTAIAVAIGVPLAIFATRRPRLASPLVAIASVVQTIPSLAMFGFLLPVPLLGGVGARAALVVLVLYGLLPIVRSTIVGHHRHRPVDSRRRRRDGDAAARDPPADRAAAGDARDRRRHSRRRRGRRRLRDHRRRHRCGRARSIHLSRLVDGRLDRHPRRRDPGRAAGAHGRRQPAVGRTPAVRGAVERVGHDRRSPPRHRLRSSCSPAARSWPSARRARSSSVRRISPSSWCSARSSRRRSSARPAFQCSAA